MKLTLGFSPCPNDTFIFDALVNNKIDTEGLAFDVVLEDVQTLNQWALEGKLNFSKISYGVLPLVLDNYVLLNSGGALGKGVGPLLISNSAFEIADLGNRSIAIPGKNTTAHLLFSLAFPYATNKQFIVFHEIEDAVLNGRVDAGVIIHENRFTYKDKGLKKIIDLGEYWEQQLNVPIPLGGIIANRKIDREFSIKVDRLIKKSLEYAFANYPLITDYVKQYSQEMSEAVMKQHIDLYVNNYSLGLGDDGKKAVLKLMEVYQQLHQLENINSENIFME
jgi:1,4-dihydroxy-6-naphthoate synthase